MNAIAPQISPVSALPSADELDRALRDASPAEIIAAALKAVDVKGLRWCRPSARNRRRC